MRLLMIILWKIILSVPAFMKTTAWFRQQMNNILDVSWISLYLLLACIASRVRHRLRAAYVVQADLNVRPVL